MLSMRRIRVALYSGIHHRIYLLIIFTVSLSLYRPFHYRALRRIIHGIFLPATLSIGTALRYAAAIEILPQQAEYNTTPLFIDFNFTPHQDSFLYNNFSFHLSLVTKQYIDGDAPPLRNRANRRTI
jgi:hypothetical protein